MTALAKIGTAIPDSPAKPWLWHDNIDPADAFARMAGHPDFASAARALAASTVITSDADPALGSVFKDAGRYVTAMLVLYLHALGGITLAQLKAFCAASGYVSPGRARTLLSFLQHLGYVENVRSAGGRSLTYLPSTRFSDAWREHLRAVLSAAAIIDPGILILVDRLSEPEVFAAFLRVQAARLHSLAQHADQTPPFVRLFMHRYGGLQILSMVLANDRADGFPSPGSLPIPIAQTARRFGVSHVHVRRLLRDAEREDLLHYTRNGTITFAVSAQATIRLFFAAQLVELVASANETLLALA